jgi:molybdopterin-binding protein
MSEIKISEAARLLGVSPDTVRRWADTGRLGVTRTAGGHRSVESSALAQLMTEQAPFSAPRRQSARNHFEGLVTRVVRDGVMAQVEMQAGPFRVVSLMSREAADELDLQPGSMAVAVIKATNVVIQLP